MRKLAPKMNELQEQQDDRGSCSSSSSSTNGFYDDNCCCYNNQLTNVSSSSSSSLSSSSSSRADRSSSFSSSSSRCRAIRQSREGSTYTSNGVKEGVADSSLLVKVYMEGIRICKKLDLTIQRGYHTLFPTLSYIFNVPIFCPDVNNKGIHGHNHVLTYEDKDGDWMLVGDVPWEMFLNTVKKLRIQRHVG